MLQRSIKLLNYLLEKFIAARFKQNQVNYFTSKFIWIKLHRIEKMLSDNYLSINSVEHFQSHRMPYKSMWLEIVFLYRVFQIILKGLKVLNWRCNLQEKKWKFTCTLEILMWNMPMQNHKCECNDHSFLGQPFC